MKTPLISLLFLLFSCAAAVAQQSDADNKIGLRHDNFYNDKLRFLLEIERDYKRRNEDTKEIQRAFLKLFQEYANERTDGRRFPEWANNCRRGQEFLDLKPQDPLSQIFAAHMVSESAHTKNVLETDKLIRKAVGKLEERSIESRIFAMGALIHSIKITDRVSPRKRREYQKDYVDTLFEWISAPNAPELERVMFETVQEFLDSDVVENPRTLEEFKKLIEKDDKIKPWLEAMILGDIFVREAWLARGTGYADTVKEEDWEVFHEKLGKAGQKYQAAYAIHPERPESASAMIKIAMATETQENERKWFDRAIKAEFDFESAYSRYYLAISPNWGGSHEAMLDFGRECMESGRYDTLIPLKYSTVVRDIIQRYGDRIDEAADLIVDQGIHHDLRELFEHYVEFHRESEDGSDYMRRFYQSASFRMAFILGQLEDAYEIYQQYDGEVIHSGTERYFLDRQESTKYLASYVVAANGAAGDLAKWIQSEAHFEAGMNRNLEDCEEILEKIELAIEMNDLPDGDLFLQVRKELIQKEIEFHQGQWVELEFTEDLRHWSKGGTARYTPEAPNSVVAVHATPQTQYLAYMTSFAPPYQVELRVENLKYHSRCKNFECGLVCGRVNFGKGHVMWVDTFQHRMGLNRPYGRLIGIEIEKKQEAYDMKGHICHGYTEWILGDQIQTEKDEEFEPGRLSVALVPWSKVSGEVRYSNLRVRKVDLEAPPSLKESEDRITYYENRIDYYKKRLGNHDHYSFIVLLGISYFNSKKYEQAREAFGRAVQRKPDRAGLIKLIGDCFMQEKQFQQAEEKYLRALAVTETTTIEKEKLRRPTVLKELCWVKAIAGDDKVRDAEQAATYLKEFRTLKKAKEFTVTDYSVIAAVEAASGQFEDAVASIDKAIGQCKKSDTALIERLKDFKKHYKDHKPFISQK